MTSWDVLAVGRGRSQPCEALETAPAFVFFFFFFFFWVEVERVTTPALPEALGAV
jgi:hypothetical protein